MRTTDTTLVDIYEAAGGTVSEDRTQVSMTPPLKPFDIVLRVVPVGLDYYSMNEEPEVTFSVLLDDSYVISEGPLGGMMRHVQHEAEVKLPANQVRLLKKEQEQNGN